MTTIRRCLVSAGSIALVTVAAVALPSTGTERSLEPSLEPLWEVAWPVHEYRANDIPIYGWGLAVDTGGHLWVSTADDTFDIYDRDGNHRETWGTAGREDGQFDFETPDGHWGDVAFRPDGGFYVTDADNARVQEFGEDRDFIRAWGEYGTGDDQFITPDSIGLDDAGNIHVIEHGGDQARIHSFDPGRSQVRLIADRPALGPFMAVDPDGTIYAIDEGTLDLVAYPPDGTSEVVAHLAAALSYGNAILHLPTGGFLVSSATCCPDVPENLVMVDAEGAVTHVWPNGGWDLSLDPAGDRFYIASDQLRAYALPAD